MGNTIITPSVIAKEALMQLENNLCMGKLVHRDFKKEFVKVGNTVSVRKPVKFVASDGATRVNQDVTESKIDFVINKRKHVSWKFSTQDLTLSIEEYSERYIKPAGIALANIVDYDLCSLYKDVYMGVGTAGTTPASYKAFGAAAKRLNQAAVPNEMRRLVFDPSAELEASDVLKGLYNPQMVEGAVRGMKVGVIAGMETYMDQNVRAHTKGVATGTPLVNGATQTGSSLVTDGWTNSTTGILKAGDVFTIAGVYSVNPVSGDSTGVLQEFVVTADANSGSSTGPATLAIYPPITTSGAYKTVSASPADDAEITVKASHTANIAFHKNAFGLVMCPLELPDSAGLKARMTHENTSIRVVKDYDIDADEEIIRLDILYGVKTIYPELACRLYG